MAEHEFFLKFIEEFEFPISDEITERADALFMIACDRMRMYRGDYRDLLQSFQIFIATGCRPYVYLGAAYLMVDGSYLRGSQYETEGIKHAQAFLDKARAILPYKIEIELLQARIYEIFKEKAKFKALMEELAVHPDAETSYEYAMIQMNYWEQEKNVPHIELWHKKGMERAKTDIQRLYALNRLASCFMMMGNNALAVQYYQQVVKLDPGDPWAWHNMSYMVFKRKEYGLAGQYNRNALNIMEFGNAFKVLDDLVNIWRSYRHENLVEEVPRYLSQESMNKKKERGLFGRLFGE